MGIKTFLKLDESLMEAFHIDDERLIKLYSINDSESDFSESRHRYMTGQALHLVERMFLNGHYSYSEMHDAVEHLFVCIKAKKLKLDINESYKVSHIEGLLKAYPAR